MNLEEVRREGVISRRCSNKEKLAGAQCAIRFQGRTGQIRGEGMSVPWEDRSLTSQLGMVGWRWLALASAVELSS